MAPNGFLTNALGAILLEAAFTAAPVAAQLIITVLRTVVRPICALIHICIRTHITGESKKKIGKE